MNWCLKQKNIQISQFSLQSFTGLGGHIIYKDSVKFEFQINSYFSVVKYVPCNIWGTVILKYFFANCLSELKSSWAASLICLPWQPTVWGSEWWSELHCLCLCNSYAAILSLGIYSGNVPQAAPRAPTEPSGSGANGARHWRLVSPSVKVCWRDLKQHKQHRSHSECPADFCWKP